MRSSNSIQTRATQYNVAWRVGRVCERALSGDRARRARARRGRNRRSMTAGRRRYAHGARRALGGPLRRRHGLDGSARAHGERGDVPRRVPTPLVKRFTKYQVKLLRSVSGRWSTLNSCEVSQAGGPPLQVNRLIKFRGRSTDPGHPCFAPPGRPGHLMFRHGCAVTCATCSPSAQNALTRNAHNRAGTVMRHPHPKNSSTPAPP